jgi:uroporphyrinogen-III decarboxylase
MTDRQWRTLLAVLNGERLTPRPAGFIIDSPWLPHWAGMAILDYYASDDLWLKANLKAVEAFPDVLFLPGFWAEFGMCTEPSAFGARCSFPPDEFPFAHRTIRSVEELDSLTPPDPATDGLAPFVLNRLLRSRAAIEEAGHKIRFSVSRGPLNVASFLMGVNEFLTAMILDPPRIHQLLMIITDYLVGWHALQRETFPTIDGILVLDDIIGLIGEAHFKQFARSYLKRIFAAPVSIKFLHNDADCRASAPDLAEMGVNLFNMGSEISLKELKALTKNQVTLMGNIPPRDVMAVGTPDAVREAVRVQFASLDDTDRILFSCGGGMPPGVSTGNLRAFVETVNALS